MAKNIESAAVQAERARIIGIIEKTPCYCRETYTCTRCELLAAVRAAQEKRAVYGEHAMRDTTEVLARMDKLEELHQTIRELIFLRK